MNPAACATASGRSPSWAASRSASAAPSPGTRCCSRATDSARASTSTSTGAAISAQARAREVISTCPAPPGSHGRDVGGVLGVVEDQQPPAALAQVGQHRRPHRLAARPGLDAAQRRAQGGELVADQPGLLGVDPPGHVVVGGEPVRVLDRQLGLAHPAHALQRLHHRPVPGQQPVPHRRQQPVPAGEPRVAGRDVPHPQHAARRQRTRVPPCRGQLPQRAFHQPAQLVRAGEGLGDQPAGLHPAAERLLPGPERVIDQLRQRDPHVRGGGVQQEHQPRQPGRGRGVELQLGVGHLRLVPHRRAVPGAQHPHIHVTAAHPLRAQLRGRLVSGGKSAISTITCPAAEIARSASATYDFPPAGKFRSSEVCETNTRHRAPHPDSRASHRLKPPAAQLAPGDEKA